MATKKQRLNVMAALMTGIFMLAVFAVPSGMALSSTPITLAAIAAHNTGTNCWTAIDGKVYDLTSYISQHPGGQAVTVICGIDGTQIFSGQHSAGFLGLINSLQIGVLATPDTTAPAITVLGNSPVNLLVGASYTDAGANAFDSVDGDLTSAIVTTNTVNTAIAGTYTVSYSVTDSAGNSASASRIVIVASATQPANNETSGTVPPTNETGSCKHEEHENEAEENESEHETGEIKNVTNKTHETENEKHKKKTSPSSGNNSSSNLVTESLNQPTQTSVANSSKTKRQHTSSRIVTKRLRIKHY
jgi:cytochrome b involved in lipid metabolism